VLSAGFGRSGCIGPARLCGGRRRGILAPGRALALALTLAAVFGNPARAAGTTDVVLGLQSQKVLRGQGQSDGDAVASADLRWRADGPWRAHAGLSTLDHQRRRGSVEAQLGAGIGREGEGDWDWLLAATHYRVLGEGPARRPAYEELSASLDWAGRWQLLLTMAPAYPGPLPGGGRGRGRLWQQELGWHQRLGPNWALDVGLGRVRYGGLAIPDAGYGSLSLSWTRGPLSLSATRIHSDSPFSDVGPRALLALAWRL